MLLGSAFLFYFHENGLMVEASSKGGFRTVGFRWIFLKSCRPNGRYGERTGQASMKTFRLVLVLSLLLSGHTAFAEQTEPLADFLGPRGCAIGPPMRAVIKKAGYGTDAIDALIVRAASDPQTVRTGEWIVLPPSLCRIQPPDVRSEIHFDDPDLKVITSRMDTYAKDGLRGCFLFGPTIMDVVQKTRGWNKAKAYLEWSRFAAENLRAGKLAFYGTDPAKPPPAFLVLTGDCANIPQIDAIRRSQAIRDREFDFFIRANASDVICGQDRSVSPRANDIIQMRAGDENTNRWMAIEIAALGTAVGQFSNAGASKDGKLQPPFCHFE